MVRTVISIVVGILASMVMIILLELIGHAIYPPPLNTDGNYQEALKIYFAGAPAGLFAIILLAYALGSFVGGCVAAMIAKEKKANRAMSVGGIMMGLGVFNLVSLPHPTWVLFAAVFAFLPFSHLGGKLGVKLTSKKV